jgi:hypothetical protein
VRPERLGKFKNSPNRESNPRPSGLEHSALTTTLPRAPSFISYSLISRFVSPAAMLGEGRI